MALLSTQTITRAGLEPAFSAATGGGDTVAVGDHTFLYVKNDHTASWTVTIGSVENCNQGFDHDLAVVVPNAEERVIGPINAPRFGDSITAAAITYTGVTALTVAAITI
jgi:hypothetical protein